MSSFKKIAMMLIVTGTLPLAGCMGAASEEGTEETVSQAEEALDHASGETAPMNTAPQYEAPTIPAPTYEAPTFGAPRITAPVYKAPRYQAPTYQAPSKHPRAEAPTYDAPTYPGPVFKAPVYEAPIYKAPIYVVPIYQGAGHKAHGCPEGSAPAKEDAGATPAPGEEEGSQPLCTVVIVIGS